MTEPIPSKLPKAPKIKVSSGFTSSSEATRKKTPRPDELGTIIALLREYTEKLNALAGLPSDRWIREGVSHNAKAILLEGVRPLADELARFASQAIEHQGLDPLIRLELRLRLAEFEAALNVTELDVMED